MHVWIHVHCLSLDGEDQNQLPAVSLCCATSSSSSTSAKFRLGNTVLTWRRLSKASQPAFVCLFVFSLKSSIKLHCFLFLYLKHFNVISIYFHIVTLHFRQYGSKFTTADNMLLIKTKLPACSVPLLGYAVCVFLVLVGVPLLSATLATDVQRSSIYLRPF